MRGERRFFSTSNARARSGEMYSTRVHCFAGGGGVVQRRSIDDRKAVRVLPLPVGAQMSVCSPSTMCGQPCTWAGVGSGNEAGTRRERPARTARARDDRPCGQATPPAHAGRCDSAALWRPGARDRRALAHGTAVVRLCRATLDGSHVVDILPSRAVGDPAPPLAASRVRPVQRPRGRDYLAVATPGAGKTTFALTCARWALGQGRRALIVVAPTSHLKLQWAAGRPSAGPRARPRLDARRRPRPRRARPGHHLPARRHRRHRQGAARPRHRRVRHPRRDPPRRRRTGVGRLGPPAFEPRRTGGCAVSGTPFRSDTAAIPFVRYDGTGRGRRGQPTTPTATPMRCATAASSGPSTSRASTG